MVHQRHILDPMSYGSDIFSPRCSGKSSEKGRIEFCELCVNTYVEGTLYIP